MEWEAYTTDIHFSQFWRLDISETTLHNIWLLRALFLAWRWPPFYSLYLYIVERGSSGLSSTFYKGTNVTMKAPHSWFYLVLITSQSPNSWLSIKASINEFCKSQIYTRWYSYSNPTNVWKKGHILFCFFFFESLINFGNSHINANVNYCIRGKVLISCKLKKLNCIRNVSSLFRDIITSVAYVLVLLELYPWKSLHLVIIVIFHLSLSYSNSQMYTFIQSRQ